MSKVIKQQQQQPQLPPSIRFRQEFGKHNLIDIGQYLIVIFARKINQSNETVRFDIELWEGENKKLTVTKTCDWLESFVIEGIKGCLVIGVSWGDHYAVEVQPLCF